MRQRRGSNASWRANAEGEVGKVGRCGLHVLFHGGRHENQSLVYRSQEDDANHRFFPDEHRVFCLSALCRKLRCHGGKRSDYRPLHQAKDLTPPGQATSRIGRPVNWLAPNTFRKRRHVRVLENRFLFASELWSQPSPTASSSHTSSGHTSSGFAKRSQERMALSFCNVFQVQCLRNSFLRMFRGFRMSG